MMISNKNQSSDLYEAIAALSTAEDVQALLIDLCTPQELMALTQRFAVAKMLWNGKYYSEIIEATGASSATVSRVKRSIYNGNGYELVFGEHPAAGAESDA